MKILIHGGHVDNVFLQALEHAGIQHTRENDASHSHVYCGIDKWLPSYYVNDEPWVALTNKERAAGLLADAGLPTLPQINLQSKEQLMNCGFTSVLIKPSVNTGGVFRNKILNETVFYKIFNSPQRLTQIIDYAGSKFWDALTEGEYIVQQAAINDDGTTTHIHMSGLVNGQGECVWQSPMEGLRKPSAVGNIRLGGLSLNEMRDTYGVIEQAEKIVRHFNIANKFLKLQWVVSNGVAYCTDISYTYAQWKYGLFLSFEVLADHMRFVYDMQPQITQQDNWCYLFKQYETGVDSVLHDSVAINCGLKLIKTTQPCPFYAASGDNEQQVLEKFSQFESQIKYA